MNSSTTLQDKNTITKGKIASVHMHRPNINIQNKVLNLIFLAVSNINNTTADVPNIPSDNLLTTLIVPEHQPTIHKTNIGAKPTKK